jgi:hypothetical protein
VLRIVLLIWLRSPAIGQQEMWMEVGSFQRQNDSSETRILLFRISNSRQVEMIPSVNSVTHCLCSSCHIREAKDRTGDHQDWSESPPPVSIVDSCKKRSRQTSLKVRFRSSWSPQLGLLMSEKSMTFPKYSRICQSKGFGSM